MVEGLPEVVHFQFLSGPQEQEVPDLIFSVTLFFIVLFIHFSNSLSPPYGECWANPEVCGFLLHLHFV